jgi:hypothetical protein
LPKISTAILTDPVYQLLDVEEISRVVDLVVDCMLETYVKEAYALNPERQQDLKNDRHDFKRMVHLLAMKQVSYSHLYALNDKFCANPKSKFHFIELIS